MTSTLEWAGCTTFKLKLDGTIVLLDAFFDRAPDAVPTGYTAENIGPVDWILIGHSHTDHMSDADTVARATG
ncbi:MAG TPA: MBL fold metallo-hydrolase, partial [Pseudolysinimonas sp.]|nr:MBL fold metallo-hydrolase [Pseudolysinimonas sp.]